QEDESQEDPHALHSNTPAIGNQANRRSLGPFRFGLPPQSLARAFASEGPRDSLHRFSVALVPGSSGAASPGGIAASVVPIDRRECASKSGCLPAPDGPMFTRPSQGISRSRPRAARKKALVRNTFLLTSQTPAAYGSRLRLTAR